MRRVLKGTLVTVIAVGAFSACGANQQNSPTEPAPPAAEADTTPAQACAPPGQLDPELVALAIRADSLIRFRLRVDESGAIQKFAVYHEDADEIPEAVRAAAEARFPDSQVRYYESERYSDRGRVHEVEVATSEGQHCELSAQTDGTLVYVECEITADEVPEAIMAEANRRVPGGELVEAETKEGPEINTVHLQMRVGEQTHYLIFQASGEFSNHYLRVPATIDIPVASE